MLGILPYERFSQQRSAPGGDRGFKSYHSAASQVPLQSPYYPTFPGHPSYMHPMDLRHPESSQMDSYSKMDYHRFTGYNTGSYPPHGSFGFYGSPPSHQPPSFMNMFDSSPPFFHRNRMAGGLTEPARDEERLPDSSSLGFGPATTERIHRVNPSGDNRDNSSGQCDSSAIGRATVARSCSSAEVSAGAEISSPEIAGSNPVPASGTTCRITGRNRSKKRPTAVPCELKDKHYWDKRRKNNESAKRSREARRRQEASLSKHMAGLEQEYVQLKADIAVFSSELEQLRQYLMPHATYEQQQQMLQQYQHQRQHSGGMLSEQQQQHLSGLHNHLHPPLV